MRPVSTDTNQDPRALIEAIKNGEIENIENLENVKKLLSDVYDFNKWHIKDENKDSLLHIAVKSGNNEILELLLEKGLNPLVVDKDNNNPLHLAAKNNNADMVATLLPYHSLINRPGQYGNTALHFAAKNGNVAIAKSLLEKGANLEATDNSKNTPMHYAVNHEDTSFLSFLIEQKANISADNLSGRTPLHLATSAGNINAVKILVKNKADVNAAGEDEKTTLDYAAEWGHTEVASFLRRNRAISSVQKSGAKSTTRGSDRGTVAGVNLGIIIPNVNWTHPDYSQFSSFASALIHLANHQTSDYNAENVSTKLIEIKTFLTDNSGNFDQEMFKNIVNGQNEKGNTALHRSCVNGSPEIADILLEAGANADKVNYGGIAGDFGLENGGCTPFHLCAFHGNPDVAKVLIKHKANPNIGEFSNEWPPLQICSLGEDENKHLGVLKALLDTVGNDKAVEINKDDKDGITALMNCVYNSDNGEGVRALLKAGADFNLQAKKSGNDDFSIEHRGCSALHFAVMRNKSKAMKALLEKNPDLELENVSKETALALAVKKGKTETVKLLYESGAKIDPKLLEDKDITKSTKDFIVSLGTEEKRNERLLRERISSIKDGEELEPNHAFTNDTKLEAIKSIKLEEVDGDPKINSSYRKLIELNDIGVKNKDTDNSDKMIKAALDHPEEFKTLFETISQINKLSFEKDERISIDGVSDDEEKNIIIVKLEKALDPSSSLKLQKSSLKDVGSKLEKNLSAKFKTALGTSASALINNLIGESSLWKAPGSEIVGAPIVPANNDQTEAYKLLYENVATTDTDFLEKSNKDISNEIKNDHKERRPINEQKPNIDQNPRADSLHNSNEGGMVPSLTSDTSAASVMVQTGFAGDQNSPSRRVPNEGPSSNPANSHSPGFAASRIFGPSPNGR